MQKEYAMSGKAVKCMIGGLVSAGITFLVLDVLFEQVFFKVKTFQIGKKGGERSIRILHLTDLHFHHKLTLKYQRLAAKINEIAPDIILISGDALDKDGQAEPLENFLRLIKYHIPKVAILGNHEYLSEVDNDELKKLYRRTNCDLLINESKAYKVRGIRLMVTGLDDLLKGDENFVRAVKDVGYEAHHFALIHSPKHQEKIRRQILQINNLRPKEEQLNIYALFAGHNHGGQVKLGTFVPYFPPESGDYIEGWYNDDKPYLYLSRGFGTSKFPIRFGARAEVTVFEYMV